MGNNLDHPSKKKQKKKQQVLKNRNWFFFFCSKENNNCDIFQKGRLIWLKIKGENETIIVVADNWINLIHVVCIYRHDKLEYVGW